MVIQYLHFSITLLSSVLLVDLFINFKKPVVLKLLLMAIVAGITIHNLSILLNWPYSIQVFSRFFILIAGINILYYLYKMTLQKFILLLSILLLSIPVFMLKIDFLYSGKIPNAGILSLSVRIFLTLIVFYLYGNLYWKLISSLNETNIYSKKIKKWLIFFIIIFVIGVINIIYLQFFPTQIAIVRILTISVHLSICIIIFYRPKFINRTKLAISLGHAFRQYSIADIEEDQFILEFYTNQYYLKETANLENFAQQMNIDATILKAYIYKKNELNFTDLVNKSRVDHFITIASSNQYKNLTIEGLSKLCGFGSKQSFYRYFKKFNGGNPSNLIWFNE